MKIKKNTQCFVEESLLNLQFPIENRLGAALVIWLSLFTNLYIFEMLRKTRYCSKFLNVSLQRQKPLSESCGLK